MPLYGFSPLPLPWGMAEIAFCEPVTRKTARIAIEDSRLDQ